MLSQDGTGGAEQLAHKPYKFKLVILVFQLPLFIFQALPGIILEVVLRSGPAGGGELFSVVS